MPSPHGAYKKGLILCPTDLRVPSWQELDDLKDAALVQGITHLVCVHENQQYLISPGWKYVRVLGTTREDAIEIAKRHCAMCEEVIVLDTPTLEKGTDIIEKIQPLRECNWAPVRGGAPLEKPWEGLHERTPMDFQAEISIPCLDCGDMIDEVVGLWRAQTVKPYIVLVDCGSTPDQHAKLESMRAEDLEIHTIRMNGTRHPSDFPAVACDLAFSMCRSNVAVTTHSDVFLRRRDVLEELLSLCNEKTPAVGYQMTERQFPHWAKTVSHTLSAFWMPVMWAAGAQWSLARYCSIKGIGHYPNSVLRNDPDTENLLSFLLEQHGVSPMFIGTEENEVQTVDARLRHVRSLTGARLYSPAHCAKAEGWLKDALVEARQNIKEWSIL